MIRSAEVIDSNNSEECGLIIEPLIENLEELRVIDPSCLIGPNEVNLYPIGMENFKSKSKINRQNNSPKIEFTIENSENKYETVKKLWQKAAMKIKLLKDPWYEFHIEEYPVEIVLRHRYNPLKKEWKKDKCFVKMEKSEFAHGAMRACFRLKKLSNFSHEKSWRLASNYVAKCYKSADMPRERYFDDVRLQMDAKLWAEVYNRHNPPKKIDMFQVYILEFENRKGSPLFHLEHYIEGNYIKYNSNAGFVEDAHIRYTPHAFSHFTFESSNHEIIVVDIQGVGDLYTDPQIHTAHGEDYGEGNLGAKGFALFFYSHVCNDICKSLGLTEFDLSPKEIESHKNTITCLMNSSCLTKRRGNEEPLYNVSMSARSRYLKNRFRYTSDNYNDIYELDETPDLLTFPSSSSSNQSASNLSPGIDCLSKSLNSSMADSFVLNEDLFKHLSKPRASAVLLEKNALLNSDTEFARCKRLDSYESILGKVHLEMCKYHENGRFLNNDNDQIDFDSAFFHLQQSSNLGVIESLVNIAKIYMQFPHDILPDYKVEETDQNYETGYEYMLEAADKGEKNSIYFVANAFYNGVGLSKPYKVDWNRSVEYFRKLISLNKNDLSNEDLINQSDIVLNSEPEYIILGRLGQMYLEGINGIEKNAQEANELFTEAAEKAISHGNGRFASKYYDLAEKASAESDDFN